MRSRYVTMLSTLWLASSAAASVHAEGLKLDGVAPDAQLEGGAGFALRKALDNPFMARVRVGALYAKHDWIANLGVTFEAGGLARLGIGGELELNVAHGVFAAAGVSRVSGGEWMSHLTIGWLVFGVEWQHRYVGTAPSDAFLTHVRVPLGTWWLRRRQSNAVERMSRNSLVRAVGARGRAEDLQRAEQDAVRPPPPPSPLVAAPVEPRVKQDAQRTAELQDTLARAEQAHAAGDTGAETLALARAYSIDPLPEIGLQLAAAEESHGKWRLAFEQLQRVLLTGGVSEEQRTRAQQSQVRLQSKMPHVRVGLTGSLAGEGELRILIDEVYEPIAAFGYDVLVDPGDHVVRVERAGRSLVEQKFVAIPGELTRLSLVLPGP